MNSTSRILSFLVILSVGFAGRGQGAAEQRLRVKTLVGTAEVRAANGASWRPARVGMPVKTGWDIRTFVESSMELRFESGTVLRIGENSVVTLSNLSKDQQADATNSRVKVATGEVWGNVQKLVNKKSKFDFETPTAVASIRGTRLGIAVKEGATAIDVYEGAVAVKRKGSTRESMLTEKTRAVIRDDSRDIEVVPFDHASGAAQDTTLPPPVDPFARTDSLAVDSANSGSVDSTVADSAAAALDSAEFSPDSAAGTVDTTAQGGIDATLRSAAVDSLVDSVSSEAPALELSIREPRNGAVVSSKTVTVQGATAPGASVRIGDLAVSAGMDGAFAGEITLEPGVNAVTIVAQNAEARQTAELSLEWYPPLSFQPRNLSDNMEVASSELNVDLELSEGAQYSMTVNDRESANPLQLEPGKNVIRITAWDQWDNVVTQAYTVIYRQTRELYVSLTAPRNGAALPEPSVQVTGATLPGAEVTVNNVAVRPDAAGLFRALINLTGSGPEHTIEVSARLDGQEATVERTVSVQQRLALNIITPHDNMVITRPFIQITGRTSPGARLMVDDAPVIANAEGGFNHQVYVPDEEGEYTFEIVAQTGDSRLFEQRTVRYQPPRQPLSLTVTTPADGQAISRPFVKVIGHTSGRAAVRVNGRAAAVSTAGAFSANIPVTERDIGDYPLEITASNDEEEIAEHRTVEIDVASAQINTSPPSIAVSGQNQIASRTDELLIQAMDRTPDDQITVTVEINGSNDELALDPGGSERVRLVEGKNAYTVRARDRAGNQSPPVSGERYYLPGPLAIEINEPFDNPYVIDDLPPMPRGAEDLSLELEVEIDDGIGSAPETIKYCRVTVNGAAMLLKQRSRYVYGDRIPVRRGANTAIIVAEDIAGNKATETLQIEIH